MKVFERCICRQSATAKSLLQEQEKAGRVIGAICAGKLIFGTENGTC